MTLITQDPLLFSGTLRFNLDPTYKYPSTEISRLLGKVEMLGTDLTLHIAEEGANLSQGQRQLVCLWRAILRQSRLVILDEASAHLDENTERKMQMLLLEEFRSATILKITHRLSTLKDSDKIVVMRDGRVVEQGSYTELMEKEDGHFCTMVRDK